MLARARANKTDSGEQDSVHRCLFANLFRQAPSLYHCNYFFLPLYSSETVNFARPLARRAANTRRPFFVAILSRKPCLFFLFLLEGWNVLFIVLLYFILFIFAFQTFRFTACKITLFFHIGKVFARYFCFFISLSLRLFSALLGRCASLSCVHGSECAVMPLICVRGYFF